jgi:hypothetical protein
MAGERTPFSPIEAQLATLRSRYGIVVFRATKPGDYPPLKPGQVETTRTTA